jgi:hypothetical protein
MAGEANPVVPVAQTKKGRKWRVNAADVSHVFIQNMDIELAHLTDADIDMLIQDPSVKTALMPFLTENK